MTTPIERLRAAVDGAVGHQAWCTGAAVSCLTPDGRLIDLVAGVDGGGRRLDEATMFPVYCASKPLTAIAVARLVTLRELSFDDRVADVLTNMGLDESPVTIDDLLSHRTGVWRYPAENFLALAPEVRREHVLEALRIQHRPETPTYAEFVGWELLRYVIEEITGSEWHDVITQEVLRPWDLNDGIAVDPAVLLAQIERLGMNVSYLDGRPVPLLWERRPDRLADTTAATGAYASANGLCRFYGQVLRELREPTETVCSRDTLIHLMTPNGSAGEDIILRRHVEHGHGFMIDLPTHHYGSKLSAASAGHSGLNGMTFGGLDRELGLAFAVHLNAVTPQDGGSDARHSALRRRELLTELIVDAALDDTVA